MKHGIAGAGLCALCCLLPMTALADSSPATPDDVLLDELLEPQTAGEASGEQDAQAARGESEPPVAPESLPTIPVAARTETVPALKTARAPAGLLEEIVVTATKREANPRDLPGSVTALGAQELEMRGAQGQEDFLKLVPGVTFTNDSINASRITFRGIGADLNTSSTTGVFLGDVPFDDPVLPRVTLDPNPFDFARIEVLKGPQGTLFGGSALNGAVRYVPQEPRLEQWELKTFAQTELVHEGGMGQIYGAAVNIPVGETFALRVVGFDRGSPGWVDDLQRGLDDVNEVEQRGGRVLGLWQPSERWKISGMAVLQETDVLDSAVTDNREGRLSRSNTPKASPTNTRYDLETLGIQYSFERFDLLSQTSRTYKEFHARIDVSRIANLMDRPPPLATTANDNESKSFMQELRFTSNDGFSDRWKLLGGAFYRRLRMVETTDLLTDVTLPLPPALLQALGRALPGLGGTITENGQVNLVRGNADPIVVEETALFGETTGVFWGSLEVTLGLRAFRAVSDSRVIFSGALAANQTLPNGSLQAVKEGRLEEQGLNPKIAVKYQVNENVGVYGAVSRGFRFGGAQVLVGTLTSRAPDTYKSDTIWSYELGLRTQWLDDTLQIDITPFQLDWIDPQLQQSDSSGVGAYFDNVGGARSRGVELALRYLTPLPGLALAFSGSWVDTVTTKPFTANNGDEIEPGTRWPLAAEWQTAATLSYARPLAGAWNGGGALTYTTISSAPNTLAYLDSVFGYETLDAVLTLGNDAISGRPELSLSLVNLTDERGVVSGVNNPQFAKDHGYIRPRTFVARIGLSF
ncbi:TonB-dependent receptor [Solimonas sp. SE-A11]|uniref:TonB-dependent receptor n=1 Tax=Solimonas sp. SE-A11 TaxID=3054954 RepID=UPI00259CA6E7|nr:TonB-dependent receptor [Solimonas sp. SE-A11]MDM4769830.1 TonB-dependent receptor [Solimonas sp. SE-A11]